MLVLAGEHVRDRFEAAMRMVGGAERGAGLPAHRAEVIDQQERVEVTEPCNRERPAHGKAAALDRAQGLDDAGDAPGLQSGRSVHGGVHGVVESHTQGE